MFDNIGKKIKMLAETLTALGVVASVFAGILTIAADEDLALKGFLIIVIGSLASWLGSFLLYGFGQLIENSDKLVELCSNGQPPAPFVSAISTPPAPPTQSEVTLEELSEDTTACPFCNYVQPRGRNVCWQCGKKFE